MTFEIWIDAAWAKGGYGGWSYVCFGPDEPRGLAGGERRTTLGRMALTAAVEALESLAASPTATVRITTADRDLLAGSNPEGEDRDLWDRLAKALAGRKAAVAFVERSGSGDKARQEFVQGWAAFALDIAKTKGAFSSAIPKRNLQAVAAKS